MIKHRLILPNYTNISDNISERFHNYVNIAKDFYLSGSTSHGRTFHVTFATTHNKVLSVGFNDYNRTINYIRGLGKVKHYDSPQKNYNMCLHSELSSILKLGKNYDFSTISFFNVRIDKNGHCRESRPCANCLATLRILGAKRVYFYDEKDNCFKYIKPTQKI